MSYPPSLNKLVQLFRRLPGVGVKSAERFAFFLLNCRAENLQQIAHFIQQLPEAVQRCQECGALAQRGECLFCTNQTRDSTQICVVNEPQELFAIERTGKFRGLYHVCRAFEGEAIERLQLRVDALQAQEVILAFDATFEAEGIALRIKQALSKEVKISRLAFGIPLGGLLEFADGATLSCAFEARRLF